ncbi:MAG: hypothetical protein JXX14_03885 [Deltaproteobacteria bacterium]|nr:hypothetical protein [Deltaproteobacteria bacterium]
MKLGRSRKPAIFLTVLIFLMVGGAAAVFYVINSNSDPLVEADISAHFAAIDDNEGDLPVFSDSGNGVASEILLYSSGKRNGAGNGKDGSTPAVKANRHTGKHSGKSNGRPESKNGITRIDSGTWLIEDRIYRHAQKNLLSYVGSAQAELAEDEDGAIGFKLRNIKKDSYLHDIGLRNNDVLVAVNGHALNSVQNVTLAIASFKKATQFRLDLLRKSKKHSFYYKIVKG